jgi:hypothetical protein
MAVASPPAELISCATVVIVEADELGSGGKGDGRFEGSLMVFAATTTWVAVLVGSLHCRILVVVGRTGIAIRGEVDGNLTTDAPGCTNN